MSGSRIIFIVAGVTLFLFGLYRMLTGLGVLGHRHAYSYGSSYGSSYGYGGHSSSSQGALIFLGLFLLVTGGGFLAWGLRSRANAQGAAQGAAAWPTVPGVVVSSMVTQNYPLVALLAPGRPSQHDYFVPNVRYRYTVGQEYEGTRIRFGSLKFRTPGRAQELVHPYPEGAPVTVRYDPANPAESVLELAITNGNSMVGIIGGAIMAGIGLLLLIVPLALG